MYGASSTTTATTRLFYVACTRARDLLILTSTQAEANQLCGLSLLQPGLELANIPCSPVSFSPEDAQPPELSSPSPRSLANYLLNSRSTAAKTPKSKTVLTSTMMPNGINSSGSVGMLG